MILIAWLPYMVIAVVLVVTRVPSFGLKPLVTGTSLTVANIMGIEKLDWTWRYLNNPGLIFLAVAPYIGVLGAFVAGSHTVSNILFAPLQFKAANLLALSPVLVVSLQSVGGAIGNMTCINNVVAVCATTGVTSGEGRIIVRNLIPTLIYATLATLIALLLA